MASDDESDVSAITLSDDDVPKQRVAVPPKQAPKPTAGAGGSGQAAATGSAAASKTAGAAERGKGRVAFRLPEGDASPGDPSDAGHGDEFGDGDAENPGFGDGAAVKDESKPLGWSYFRKRDATEGPVAWGEVEVTELRFVAENLVRSTTKRASQADDVIQQIFQAGSLDDDALVTDPLGRGVIDPVTLTLGKRSKMVRMVQPASGEKGLKATMRTFRTARLGSKPPGSGGEAGAGSSQAGAGGRVLDEEARKVLPNQEGFDPEAYLATFHAESSMGQLEKGLRSLSRELSERTGQLKLLIRNNFDRFINCKDAIDDIHAKMRKMLVRGTAGGSGPGPSTAAAGAGGSSSAAAAVSAAAQLQQQQGVGTDRVFRSLEQVEGQARRTFGPILDRADKADRIRAVAGLLQRFDHLFAAPQRILELAGRGELEQVVREYTRANMLIRPTPTTARVWVSLYSEIEKHVTEVYLAVKQLVTEAPPEGRPMGQDGPVALFGVVGPAGTAPGGGELEGTAGSGEEAGQLRLHQLPDYLLFLALVRQERLPAAREEDPMRLYVSRLETHVDARIQACDEQHTALLSQLVTAWMRASPGGTGAGGMGATGGGGGGGGGTASPSLLRSPTAGGVAALRASVSSLSALNAHSTMTRAASSGNKPNGPTGGRSGGAANDDAGAGDSDLDGADDDGDLDEDGEAAEAAFLLWRGGLASSSSAAAASSSPFLPAAAPLPYHIRTELRRLVQDPGGRFGSGGGGATLVPVGGSSALLLYGGGRGGGAGGDGTLEPLPTSAHAQEPALTAAQRHWVSYVCSISALLLWSLPGLWATCNSLKYGSNGDLGEQAKEGLERGPSLARRLVEGLCKKYAVRLRRTAQSLARAGPMQPGLPLIIKDACHLWASLRRVGIPARTLSALRGAVVVALAAHVAVLGDHLAALPQLLFGADDFRLDLLAADQQPVTALPRRLEEEMGVALLHYQWPLSAVVEAAGGVEEVPAESSWRPMQGSVFACFSLLSEALAEYARGLYAARSGGGGDDDDGSSSFRSRTLSGSSSELELGATGGAAASASAAAGAAQRGAPSSSTTPRALYRVPNASTGDTDEGPAQGSLWSDVGGTSSNDNVRMLLIIGNSAVIRTRIMPGVVERHRKLLAPTAEASTTCHRRLRDLTSAMRRSNEALGSSYLARKEANVQAAVRRYVAAGTAPLLAAASADPAAGGASAAAVPKRSKAAAAAAAALLPGPSGPSAGCCALLQLLTGIHNEALAYSPSNLRSFVEALVECLVGELGPACQGLAAGSGASAGGTGAGPTVEQLVQLWADLEFLTSALRPLLTKALGRDLKNAQVALGTAVALRQRARRYRPASAPAEAVAGAGDGGAVSQVLRELLAPDVESWLRRHALNVRCFAAAAAAAANTAAAAGGPAASSGADVSGGGAAAAVAVAPTGGREGGSRGAHRGDGTAGSSRGHRAGRESPREPALSPKSTQQQEGRRRAAVSVAATGDDTESRTTGRGRRATVATP